MGGVRLAEVVGALLISELARRGRRAYLGGDRGVTFLIMTADSAAPDDEGSTYTTAHLLMYAGEHADRPAAEHTEPWSAHLHDAEGNYVDTLFAGVGTPLDAETDTALFATQVRDWLDDRRRATARPDSTPAPDRSTRRRVDDLTLAELLASAADNHAGLTEHLVREERDEMYDTITNAYVTQIGVTLTVALSTAKAAFPTAQPPRKPYVARRPLREVTLADLLSCRPSGRAWTKKRSGWAAVMERVQTTREVSSKTGRTRPRCHRSPASSRTEVARRPGRAGRRHARRSTPSRGLTEQLRWRAQRSLHPLKGRSGETIPGNAIRRINPSGGRCSPGRCRPGPGSGGRDRRAAGSGRACAPPGAA